MGWLIESLANIILELLNDLMAFVAVLIQGMSFTDQMEDGLYMPIIGNTFPALSGFLGFFRTIAIISIPIITIIKLFQTLYDEKHGEHPFSLIARAGIAVFCVSFSYRIMSIILKPLGVIFNGFYTQMSNSVPGGIESIQAGNEAYNMFGTDLVEYTTGFSKLGVAFIFTILGIVILMYFAMLALELFQRIVVIDVMYFASPIPFSFLASNSTSGVTKKYIQGFITNFAVLALVLFFLGGFLGSVQYIQSGEHYEAVADNYPASEEDTSTKTEKTEEWKNYIAYGDTDTAGNPLYTHQTNGSVITQAEWEAMKTKETTLPDYLFHNVKDLGWTLIFMIGLLIVGTKTDQYVKDMGLTVLQTGQGIGGALLGAGMVLRTAMQTASMGARMAGKGFRAAKSAGSYIGGAISESSYAPWNSPSSFVLNESGRLNSEDLSSATTDILNNDSRMISFLNSNDVAGAQVASNMGINTARNEEIARNLNAESGVHYQYSPNGGVEAQISKGGETQTIGHYALKGSEIASQNDNIQLAPITNMEGESLCYAIPMSGDEGYLGQNYRFSSMESVISQREKGELSPLYKESATGHWEEGKYYAPESSISPEMRNLSTGKVNREGETLLQFNGNKEGNAIYDQNGKAVPLPSIESGSKDPASQIGFQTKGGNVYVPESVISPELRNNAAERILDHNSGETYLKYTGSEGKELIQKNTMPMASAQEIHHAFHPQTEYKSASEMFGTREVYQKQPFNITQEPSETHKKAKNKEKK